MKYKVGQALRHSYMTEHIIEIVDIDTELIRYQVKDLRDHNDIRWVAEGGLSSYRSDKELTRKIKLEKLLNQ